MGWNYVSIPKLQRCNRWSLGMHRLFHPTLYWACDYLAMLGLIHFIKSRPCKYWYVFVNSCHAEFILIRVRKLVSCGIYFRKRKIFVPSITSQKYHGTIFITDKDLSTQYNQNHRCWWPVEATSQVTSSHGHTLSSRNNPVSALERFNKQRKPTCCTSFQLYQVKIWILNKMTTRDKDMIGTEICCEGRTYPMCGA